MKQKKFMILQVKKEDGSVTNTVTNEGFNLFELAGILKYYEIGVLKEISKSFIKNNETEEE